MAYIYETIYYIDSYIWICFVAVYFIIMALTRIVKYTYPKQDDLNSSKCALYIIYIIVELITTGVLIAGPFIQAMKMLVRSDTEITNKSMVYGYASAMQFQILYVCELYGRGSTINWQLRIHHVLSILTGTVINVCFRTLKENDNQSLSFLFITCYMFTMHAATDFIMHIALLLRQLDRLPWLKNACMIMSFTIVPSLRIFVNVSILKMFVSAIDRFISKHLSTQSIFWILFGTPLVILLLTVQLYGSYIFYVLWVKDRMKNSRRKDTPFHSVKPLPRESIDSYDSREDEPSVEIVHNYPIYRNEVTQAVVIPEIHNQDVAFPSPVIHRHGMHSMDVALMDQAHNKMLPHRFSV